MATTSSTLCISLLCCALLAAAQSLTPTNTSSPQLPRNQSDEISLQVSRADGIPTPSMPALIPLVDAATDKLPTAGVQGSIFVASTNNIANISALNVAWISCDPQDYDGNLGAVDVLQRAVENNVSAALLYSTSSSSCNYTAGSLINPDFAFLYSMSSARDSLNFKTLLQFNPDLMPMRATINLLARQQSNNNGSSPGQPGPSQGQPGGPSPSTAVAMIILYSITGVITALFLIIIITGAIRAHRHPERYGPRAVLGRARQSRAKGLARAMLESIPIVKFGDNEGDLPKPEDVELAAASSSNVHAANGDPAESNKHDASADAAERGASDGDPVERVASRESDDGIGADVAPPPRPSSSPDAPLGCSICTEDFERGEDVRVLPCNHKFHPACIDPWLLNVSGTCPLCRIDLRPPTAHDPNDPNSAENGESAASDSASVVTPSPQASGESAGDATGSSNANLQPSEASRRQTRRFSSLLLDPLNRRRMQDATPEERIQALRQYNARNRSSSTGPEQESRRRRISARLSDAFSRGMRRNEDAGADANSSAAPATTATTLNESRASQDAVEARAPSPLSVEAAPPAERDAIVPAPEIRVQAPEGEKESAETEVFKRN